MDNRVDTSVSMRTPLKRVRGLGASGGGTEHFWLQRLTALANIPLILGFVGLIVYLAVSTRGQSHVQTYAIVSQPVIAILLTLLIVSITVHMRLGMQIIIEDYVHTKGLKFAALIANTFFAILVAAVSLFSVLKIAFGSL